MIINAIIFVILICLIVVYFKVADRFNIIDKPNHRSSHTQITIRGGGIVFYLSVLLYYLFYGFEYSWFFVGITLIASVSFIDDIRPMSSKIRLVVQFVAMAMMLYDCGILEYPWYYSLLALIFTTGLINIYNFMDGINGITGGYSLIVMSSLWYVNNYAYSFIDNNMLYVVMMALMIFNFFNFRRKARCFAGDIGSITIAFIICFLITKLIVATENFSYLVLLAVYGVDAVLTIVHRLFRHENILEAHRSHMYQIMANELKIPHLAVSGIYMVLQTIIAAGYFFVFSDCGNWYFISVLVVLIVVYSVLHRKYFKLHKI